MGTVNINENPPPEEVRVIAPTGALGVGFDEAVFIEAMERWDPHAVACDNGSTDFGPYGLGAGVSDFGRLVVQRDLEIALCAARNYNKPLMIGSAGTGGGKKNVAWLVEILQDIASKHDLHFTLAVIQAEQSKEWVKDKLRQGKIRALDPAPHFDEAVADRAEHIVGMMGHEPFLAALQGGADVVIAGRAADPSFFAAIPLHYGFPEALVWHASKIIECGGCAAEGHSASGIDGMMARFTKDYFELEAQNPSLLCTPSSIAAHSLFEESSPYEVIFPTGILDTRNAQYEQVGSAVRVRGSEFHRSDEYTILLEGAERVGFRTIGIGGIRDPLIIRQFDTWFDSVKTRGRQHVKELYRGSPPEHRVDFHVYGKNGVMGELEPVKEIKGHELGFVLDVVAETQEHATNIAHAYGHKALHTNVPQYLGSTTSWALAFAPQAYEVGPVYRFCLNHVAIPDGWDEMFPIEYVEI